MPDFASSPQGHPVLHRAFHGCLCEVGERKPRRRRVGALPRCRRDAGGSSDSDGSRIWPASAKDLNFDDPGRALSPAEGLKGKAKSISAAQQCSLCDTARARRHLIAIKLDRPFALSSRCAQGFGRECAANRGLPSRPTAPQTGVEPET